jgi:hypothetical protein
VLDTLRRTAVIHEIVFYTVVALLAASGYWYWHTMRQWIRFMRAPEVETLSETKRAEIMSSIEYLKLRAAVRMPIRVSLVLGCVLFFVMRRPF